MQAIDDFWQYYEPIVAGMPQNCSRDLATIVEHVDDLLLSDNRTAVHELKASFALQDLTHDDDFAA